MEGPKARLGTSVSWTKLSRTADGALGRLMKLKVIREMALGRLRFSLRGRLVLAVVRP